MEPDPRTDDKAPHHALDFDRGSKRAVVKLAWRKLPKTVLATAVWAAFFLSIEGILLVILPWPVRFAVDELFVPMASGYPQSRSPPPLENLCLRCQRIASAVFALAIDAFQWCRLLDLYCLRYGRTRYDLRHRQSRG